MESTEEQFCPLITYRPWSQQPKRQQSCYGRVKMWFLPHSEPYGDESLTYFYALRTFWVSCLPTHYLSKQSYKLSRMYVSSEMSYRHFTLCMGRSGLSLVCTPFSFYLLSSIINDWPTSSKFCSAHYF